MFALDVPQINWRTTGAHLPTEDTWADSMPVRTFNKTSQARGACRAPEYAYPHPRSGGES
jgi:hypothetical protein